MSELCIQIRPERAPALRLSHVRRICQRVAADRKLVSDLAWIEANATRAYINVLFKTARTEDLWAVLQRELYGDADCGHALQDASLVLCVGQRGWLDSRQLHPPVSQVA
jgi:hypothetical protein